MGSGSLGWWPGDADALVWRPTKGTMSTSYQPQRVPFQAEDRQRRIESSTEEKKK
jgi:hypothetical protein